MAGCTPMTGLRVMPPPERENDVGGRFTLCPGSDSQGVSRLSAGAVTSYASAASSVSAAPAAQAEMGATPQSEGLVRARTQVCFHTPAPVPWGRSRSINPYAGRRFERRFEAADHPFADRPAVWQLGITEQGRGTPDGSGHSPSRQVRDAPVPGDRWPPRTGLLDRSDLPTEGGWACTSNPPRCRTRHRGGGSLPPRPHPPERHRRSGGRGATATQPTTCGTASAHMEAAFSCTSTPMSMCTRGTPPTPPSIAVPGREDRRRCFSSMNYALRF